MLLAEKNATELLTDFFYFDAFLSEEIFFPMFFTHWLQRRTGKPPVDAYCVH